MSLWARFLGRPYADEQVMLHARQAIAADPLVNEAGAVTIASAQGVVKFTGAVQRHQEKDRSEGVIREAMRTVGLKNERMINELKVGEQANSPGSHPIPQSVGRTVYAQRR